MLEDGNGVPEAGEETGGLRLGIDTGGTFTDAVLLDERDRLVARAKVETTHGDLLRGITGAAEGVLATLDSGDAIRFVGLSTTLATNAVVEGRGGRAALVLIGFDRGLLRRGRLGEILGGDPLVLLPGGHDAHGRASEEPDPAEIAARLASLAGRVEAVAVVGRFAVRNPAHERLVARILRRRLGLPVTCSHELSGALDAARRAVTTLLNARLLPEIRRLLDAVRAYLRGRGIAAPLLVVRGDGALMRVETALERPVETLLSGPAASAVGAARLAGLPDAVIADMGGTTTDIVVLERGRPRLSARGARIAGFETMVRAIELETVPLGGDSEIRRRPDGRLVIGPRRRVPLAVLGACHPQAVEALRSQLAAPPREFDGLFGLREGRWAADGREEARLLSLLERGPVPLTEIFDRHGLRSCFEGLAKRGRVRVAGFTPSDAAHVLGRQRTGCVEAARLGAALEARRPVGGGTPAVQPVELFARWVFELCEQATARAVAAAALRGMEEEPDWLAAGPEGILGRALNPAIPPPARNLLEMRFRLMRPLVAVGAPAPLFFPRPAVYLDTALLVPEAHAVCNAIGAVVGELARRVTITVTRGAEGDYLLHLGDPPRRFADFAAAVAAAERAARRRARALLRREGVAEMVVEIERACDRARLGEGEEMVLEARVTAVARGRPPAAAG